VRDVLNGELTQGEIEVRAELISALVFRKKVPLPETLLQTTINSFNKGLSKVKATKNYVMHMVERYEITGQWIT
jgi:hypothetical protein